MPPHGLDLFSHLNLMLPRDFLLQVEDELEAFLARYYGWDAGAGGPGGEACKEEAAEVPSQIIFPALAQVYENLLITTARRFGLVASVSGRSVKVTVPQGAWKAHLPLFSYADVLRVQRPPGPCPRGAEQADHATEISRRQELRLWALQQQQQQRAVDPVEPTAGSSAASSSSAVKLEQPNGHSEGVCGSARESLDKLFAKAASPGTGGGAAERYTRPGFKSNAAVKRGRGFQDTVEAPQASSSAKLRHSYGRFQREPQLNWVQKPWPTAKLRRDGDSGCSERPTITWRREWRVGPEDEEIDEPGNMGGVISWAAQPSDLKLGEGFEVSLRSGPGEEEGGAGVADRLDGDFVLSFRRGDNYWEFQAGRRVRRAGGAAKIIPDDKWSRGQRHMFWAACLESASEGKHYVLVGTVPGILTDYFFVAKAARAEPLSRAGFSYLPEPARLQPDALVDERPPLPLEGIFVYPHVLTGELPFVSLRNLQQRQLHAAHAVKEEAPGGNGGEKPLASAVLPAREESPEGGVKAEAGAPEQLELVVTSAMRPLGEDASRGPETWCKAARLECGLAPRAGDLGAEDEAAKERALERRAKQRVTAPVLTSGLEAPLSWEPGPQQPLGGFDGLDDTARHDPSSWRAAPPIDDEDRDEQVPIAGRSRRPGPSILLWHL